MSTRTRTVVAEIAVQGTVTLDPHATRGHFGAAEPRFRGSTAQRNQLCISWWSIETWRCSFSFIAPGGDDLKVPGSRIVLVCGSSAPTCVMLVERWVERWRRR